MASIGHKEQPAAPAPPARERAKPRTVSAVDGGERRKGRLERLQTSIGDISAELRKVTWPTRDETRNLTIVVIGISVSLGLFLGGIDLLLSTLYRLINP